MSDEKTVKTKKFINTSGQGSRAEVPAAIRSKFNWGAFLLNWIWGLGNRTYLTLIYLIIGFIPIVNFVISIWFGFMGNEWAWRNKRFGGVQHFNESQKKWTIAGIIFWAIFIPVVGLILFAGLIGYTAKTAVDNPEKMEKTMTKYENFMDNITASYFETYTIDENENRFYILEKDWKFLSFSDKKNLLDLAAQTAANKREKEYKANNPNGHEYFSKTKELKRTKIYSANNNEKLLGEFYFDDSLFDNKNTGFKEVLKESMKAYRFYN